MSRGFVLGVVLDETDTCIIFCSITPKESVHFPHNLTFQETKYLKKYSLELEFFLAFQKFTSQALLDPNSTLKN